MGFVHDQLSDGKAFRVLTMVDNWSRKSVVLEAGVRLPGEAIVTAQKRVAGAGKLPKSITVDHGTGSTSRPLDQWDWELGIRPRLASCQQVRSRYRTLVFNDSCRCLAITN